jgi:hypothetical protein
MTNYLLMIYENEKVWTEMTEAQRGKMLGEYRELTNGLKGAGQWKAGEALQPTSNATTVRVRNGKTEVTDGPFAETREQLGGFYLIEAKNLDEATKIAAKIPSARHGSIEVRPLMVLNK